MLIGCLYTLGFRNTFLHFFFRNFHLFVFLMVDLACFSIVAENHFSCRQFNSNSFCSFVDHNLIILNQPDELETLLHNLCINLVGDFGIPLFPWKENHCLVIKYIITWFQFNINSNSAKGIPYFIYLFPMNK